MAKLPLSFARLLHRLQQGETIAKSEFQPKRLLNRLVEDQIVTLIRIGKNRSTILLPNPQVLTNYLANQFSISDLASYIHTLQGTETQKSDFVLASGNSKLRSRTHFRGLFVKSLSPIPASLNQMHVEIAPPPGISWFVEASQEFVPEPSCILVGVENYENFRLIHEQREFFSQGSFLFVFRYSEHTLQDWLKGLPNAYLHFGDWDPAGVCIYQEAYREVLGENRCQLFIPDNIEALLSQYGNRELYDRQFAQATRLKSDDDPAVQHLIQLLHKHQKGLEQEILIQNRIL